MLAPSAGNHKASALQLQQCGMNTGSNECLPTLQGIAWRFNPRQQCHASHQQHVGGGPHTVSAVFRRSSGDSPARSWRSAAAEVLPPFLSSAAHKTAGPAACGQEAAPQCLPQPGQEMQEATAPACCRYRGKDHISSNNHISSSGMACFSV